MSEGYDPALFATLDEVEDRHFWFNARKRVVGAVLRQLTRRLKTGYRVLELGCGNGGMLRLLQQNSAGGTVVGMDLYAQGLQHARRRSSATLVQGDVRRAPFSRPFEIVGMFDVLEHVEKDLELLRDVRQIVAPAGWLLITVPAHMELWSYFDVAACHARRYSVEELKSRLQETGFTVDYITQFMGAIYPLVWLGRRVKQAMGAEKDATRQTQNELRITPGLNWLLGAAMSGEAEMVRRRRRLTRGTSILAVARRVD